MLSHTHPAVVTTIMAIFKITLVSRSIQDCNEKKNKINNNYNYYKETHYIFKYNTIINSLSYSEF